MRLLFLFSSFLIFPSYAFSLSLLAVPEQNQTGLASIAYTLTSQNSQSKNNTFLASEKISLSFDLNIAKTDIGHSGRLYLLALYENKIYMKVEGGEWKIWDGDTAQLKSFQSKTLSQRESLPVIANHKLPGGEYLVAAGYQGRDGILKYNQSLVSFIVFDENTYQLHRVEQPEFLTRYLNNGLSALPNEEVFFTDDVFSGSIATTASSADSSLVSKTNLQESGVDEGDRIKIDGSTLFVLEACRDLTRQCLNTYQLNEFPASVTPLGELKVSEESYAPGELYLHHSSAKNQRTAIWLNSSFQGSPWAFWDTPYYWQNNKTEVQFINAANADKLEKHTQLSIDGALISSHLVGDTLYLVSRNSPSFDMITPLAGAAKDPSESRFTEMQPIAELLPEIRVDIEPAKPLVKATDCYITAQNSLRHYDASIVNITAIPVNEPHKYTSTCIAGNVETVYVSSEAIYLASNRYPYELNGNAIAYIEPLSYQTEIHKFSFKGSSLSYRATGRVNGHLGWEADKRSFRMGEYNGLLKVAASIGNTWNNTSRTRVAVLEEDAETQMLNEISALDNLGKPGERLYAARFIGHRGFLVTFKVTDPLYVLDFSVPESPAVIGELEIKGYSDYLHPVSENLLLGIGKDAVAATNTEQGAWYQGVKVSLFDITDSTRLQEVDSVILGRRGSSSTVLYDHHAVSWLDEPQTLSATLAIPVSLHDTSSMNSYYQPGDPREFFEWTHNGLYIFNIDKNTPSLTLQGKLIAETNAGEIKYGPSIHNDRSVIQGESVHFIHNNEILSSAIDELK